MSEGVLDQPCSPEMAEQYAALGRFVTVFEDTVNLVRTATIGLLASNRRSEKLVSIAFHSSVMTAAPLFQVFRAVVGQIATDEAFGYPKQQGQDILSVMNQIAGAFDAIQQTRNSLLHGTWEVGWCGEPGNGLAVFSVTRLKPSRTGLSRAEVPSSPEELTEWGDRCVALQVLIERVVQAVATHPVPELESLFTRTEQGWLPSTGREDPS
ncbi:hypothetical protein J8J14_07865 [Roseomonas sp. SSH11]|uniref:MAE-28990/MAE-18760-like HEPN domain-containing protein n=1 Tax=Pararoseomonas baculiformis TaxID=2820812 RepID=A0ABS4ACF3_9PROT|nr:hypothetical protein [Pararoseomonas baculiformis]MBP0444697.1 hypothetical protein [Pararoseomonas baculiformis]